MCLLVYGAQGRGDVLLKHRQDRVAFARVSERLALAKLPLVIEYSCSLSSVDRPCYEKKSR